MRLYPPFNKWKEEIRNPEKFHQFLIDNVETNCTNHKAKLKGKLNENGFFVERKLFRTNSSRPQIKGVIEYLQDGKQRLTLSIESTKTLLYLVVFVAIILVITAIGRSKPFVLIGVPVVAIWFYIGGFIFHSIELKETKLELNRILKKAAES